MKNKLFVMALLLILLCVSCDGMENQNWFKESVISTEPADPNVDSDYFQIKESTGTIKPKTGKVLPLTLLIPVVVDDVQVLKVSGCSQSPVQYLTVPSGITVAPAAFNACQDLDTVVLSEGVVSVGDGAFSNCTALSRVVVNCAFSAVSSVAFDNSCSAEFVYKGVSYNGFEQFRSLGL